MPWCNPFMVEYFEILDNLKEAMPHSFGTRGSKKVMRARSANNQTSMRSHCDLLPATLYDEGWLKFALEHPTLRHVNTSASNFPFLDFVSVIDNGSTVLASDHDMVDGGL